MENNSKPQAIRAKIDLNKIDGEHAFQGKKGLWQDIVLRATPNSKFGDDYMVVINIKGGEDIILGNAKVLEARKQTEPRKVKASAKLPWE